LKLFVITGNPLKESRLIHGNPSVRQPVMPRRLADYAKSSKAVQHQAKPSSEVLTANLLKMRMNL